jgi:hypothetical protein
VGITTHTCRQLTSTGIGYHQIVMQMDDSYVGRSNLQQSLHQKSYILFYRLVQQQEPETKNIQMELST